MIAQKLKNNKIAIGNGAPRKDAIEVIEDLKVSEFYRLLKAAREWGDSLNDSRDIIFSYYKNEDSKICKEFNKIVEHRKNFSEKLNTIVEASFNPNYESHSTEKPNSSLVWRSNLKGTSRLLRFPKKQIIRIIRRKGPNDNLNKINSICIDNKLREEFFHDCKNSYAFHLNSKKYEIINLEEDKDIYTKWNSIIDNIYKEGIKNEDN